MNKCLTTCRGCCKFKENRIYFAPKITDKEVANIKSNGLYKKVFYPFKNSKKIFQISLVKSKFSKDTFVCPYLDEETQICKIYKMKPFDCEFWPFLLMYDKNRKNVLIAHFNKNICPITHTMSKTKFEDYLNKSLDKWMKKKNIIKLISKYPELVWDYEPVTFIVKEINHNKCI
ncbi:MAG: YkgJ family cysteine cluster protein [Patescibacteria group bacterium]